MQSAISNRRAWFVAIVATLTMAVSYIDRQALSALAPLVTEKLHLDDAQYGLVQAAFSIAYLVGAPLAGKWIDRVGARRGLVWSMLLWTVVGALHALVPGFAALFVLRVMLGFAEAPGYPGAAQTMQRVLPPSHRSVGFGVLFTGSSIGAAIAPLVSVTLANRFGWRAAFLATPLIGLLWIPLWRYATRHGAVQTAIDENPQAGSERPRILALLREPVVSRALLLIFLSAPPMAFVLMWSAKFLHAAHGVPQAQMARYLWLPPVFVDVATIVFGAIASRRDGRDAAKGFARRSHKLLVTVASVMVASAVALPFVRDVWTSIVIAGCAYAGGGALFAMATADMLARVAPNHVSTAGGMSSAAQGVAFVLSNLAIGAVVRATHSYTAIVVALSLLVVPGAIAWLVRDPNRPRRGRSSDGGSGAVALPARVATAST
jgi:MFS family permease